MLVFDDDPVLALVGGLDLGDGHHDHVVVVTVGDHLVAPAFLDDSCALASKGRSKQAWFSSAY